MNYLIDTHILLWFIIGDKRISQKVKTIIESDANTIFLSNASLWEITIKISIGKLKLAADLKELETFLKEKGFKILEFDFDDLEKLLSLPFHHQDPFDRLLVAQAQAKSLKIITNDSQVQKYFE